MIVGMLPSGHDQPEIPARYPWLEPADIAEALGCAAWRAAGEEVVIGVG